MSEEQRRGEPRGAPDPGPEPAPAMSRDTWIAYLAGRETPAYSGWAENLPEPWRDRPAAGTRQPDRDER